MEKGVLLGNSLVKIHNIIEAAQELQFEIAFQAPLKAFAAAQHILEILGEEKSVHGSRDLFIHTLSALVLNEQKALPLGHRSYTGPADFIQKTYDEVTAHGRFDGFTYIAHQPANLQTLAVTMYEGQIIQPGDPDSPSFGRSDPPLAIPVGDIQTVLLAA